MKCGAFHRPSCASEGRTKASPLRHDTSLIVELAPAANFAEATTRRRRRGPTLPTSKSTGTAFSSDHFDTGRYGYAAACRSAGAGISKEMKKEHPVGCRRMAV